MKGDLRVAPGGTRVAPGGTRVAPGGTRVAPGETRVAPGETRVAPGETRVALDETRVAPGETGVAPGDMGVAPGETRVALGETRVALDETRVAPGETGVAPGDMRIAPGDMRVAPGETKVAPREMRVGPGDRAAAVDPGECGNEVMTTLRVRTVLVVGFLVVAGLACATAVALAQEVGAGKLVTIQRPRTVNALAFSSSGDLLLALEREEPAHPHVMPTHGTVTAWTEPTGTLVGAIAADNDMPDDIAVSRSDVLAIQHFWGGLSLLSLPKGASLGTAVDAPSGVSESFRYGPVRFSPSGERVAGAGANGSVSVWSVGSRQPLNPPPGISDCEGFLGFVSEDRIAYVASDSSIHVWSLATHALTRELAPVSSGNPAYLLSPGGTLCLRLPTEILPGWSVPESIRSVAGGRPCGEPLHLNGYDAVAFSNDDSLVAVAGNQRVFIREIKTGRLVFSSSLPDGGTGSVVFSPTRDRLAVAHGKTIFVFPFRR